MKTLSYRTLMQTPFQYSTKTTLHEILLHASLYIIIELKDGTIIEYMPSNYSETIHKYKDAKEWEKETGMELKLTDLYTQVFGQDMQVYEKILKTFQEKNNNNFKQIYFGHV